MLEQPISVGKLALNHLEIAGYARIVADIDGFECGTTNIFRQLLVFEANVRKSIANFLGFRFPVAHHQIDIVGVGEEFEGLGAELNPLGDSGSWLRFVKICLKHLERFDVGVVVTHCFRRHAHYQVADDVCQGAERGLSH